jgi:dTDP-4-dehydrorhamnose reductase
MTEKLQLWGGVECTVNRVHERYGDQIRLSGHEDRLEDIDRFAELGISAIRYPILWERVSPDRPDQCEWEWTDRRLARLRDLGIRVIAGLIHHGSGPHYTSLVDDGFAAGLAKHAQNVGERYPWITDWTPVNEPLTTARFSALYGHWYPHLRSERDFWLALLNQVDATRLSMRAIRRINPGARLIQTDDLGRTYATAALREQATFDNIRRWAGWDLLCGKVDRDHPFWARIAGFGFEQRLQTILDDPCPPDVIGINHYLTSDRFLDHRLQRYPQHLHGGSEMQLYADVEAVRVLSPSSQGLEGALAEAWERYRLPLAITEVHNGCTREEQLRWMAQAWDIASRLNSRGVHVEAVTVWSLLGSSGWNTLLTRPGVYEPGVWDISSGAPRPTAMVPLLKARSGKSNRPIMANGAGWWQRPTRLVHPPVARPAPIAQHIGAPHEPDYHKPLLISGGTGTLGQAMARACSLRNIPFILTSRQDMDITDRSSIEAALDKFHPWAVINTAGWVRVDEAEAEQDACLLANTHGAIALADACDSRSIPTLSFSSDLVFDGTKGAAYIETDAVAPCNSYGRSKAEMEAGIGQLAGDHLIIRTAAFFSPYDGFNFATAVIRSLERGEAVLAPDDLVVTPTYVPHLATASLDLLIDSETGIWHLANEEALSWADFAKRIAMSCGHDVARVHAVPHHTLGWAAPRPANVALATRRGPQLPSLLSAMEHFAQHFRAELLQNAA